MLGASSGLDLRPRAGQEVAELSQANVDPGVVDLGVAGERRRTVAGDVERVGLLAEEEGVLEPVSRVDLADRIPEVLGVGGTVPGEVAGGVERDAAVQADDHEGEERLVELAIGVGAGRVAQVEPDRVGDAVAIVVDVVGDLAGVRIRDQVGESGRVVAVGRDRAEDPRHRVEIGHTERTVRVPEAAGGPVPIHGMCGVLIADDPRPVERGDDHLAVGALDRQEPVLQVAGVVVLVHAHGVGIQTVVAEIAVGRIRHVEREVGVIAVVDGDSRALVPIPGPLNACSQRPSRMKGTLGTGWTNWLFTIPWVGLFSPVVAFDP